MNKTSLIFDDIDPVAPQWLGGLVRDRFCNGRLFATVGAHGGLLSVGYWGQQHLGAKYFFQGSAESAWTKLFRIRVRIDGKDYYLTMNDTKLYPFGYSSRCEIADVEFSHELLLLPDTLAQRARVMRNPRNLSVQIEMVHQEACTAIDQNNRTWGEFAFETKHNALIVSCRDLNPPELDNVHNSALAQEGLDQKKPDAPDATTWIAIGCDSPLHVRRGYHARSKYYLSGETVAGNEAAYFVTFATNRHKIESRLAELSNSVFDECDKLLANYAARKESRPRIDVGDPILNSAFGQYPEIINSMKLTDEPGATRANFGAYFVWGWDGMTPLIPCALANDSAYSIETFRFFQKTLDQKFGIPHAFTSTFNLSLKGPFPSQCQFIASLYHYVATTGDLSIAQEVWPTCQYLIDRCREHKVGDTGLVKGHALWPDFPEAMEENGHDISSMNNSLLYQALRAMEYLADALDDSTLAAECSDWASKLRVSFVKYLYDEEHGYFISSCSSETMAPRKHYCCQAVYWITPFGRELCSHAPDRIAAFMDRHLRSDKCLLSLPHWDTAWMADGNQLGSSYPTADYFYLNIHKLVGAGAGLDAWLGDLEWFWRHHTAPEAFTPEAENEAELGPDCPGGKQLQAVTCWYSMAFMGLAGLDFDHEGLTLTPWGNRPISINNLMLRGASIDLTISGSGNHIGELKLNGTPLPQGSRKIAWSALSGKQATIELVRSETPPASPVIVRADGLRITSIDTASGKLNARIEGDMSGEVVVQAPADATVTLNGSKTTCPYDLATGCLIIGVEARNALKITVG